MPDKKTPRFSVIIVNWNVADRIKICLQSLYVTKYPALEIIVVDNASSDHSVSLIKSIFPHLKLIQNETNRGLPKAVNQALAESHGDYLVQLNPDTELPPVFFVKCVDFFTRFPTAGVMGPKFFGEGSVYVEPGILNAFRIYWLRQTPSKYTPDSPAPLPVNAVSGACMVFPRSTYEKIGPFTEEVFMYFEDLDYCRRLRLQGLTIMFNPEIVIKHGHGQSSKQTPQTGYKNFLETLLYPVRQFVGLKNRFPSTQRYSTEAAIWYNGWIRQVIITAIIWLSEKLRR